MVFCRVQCEAPVAFALALRVALTDFEDEMRKQGVKIHNRARILGIRRRLHDSCDGRAGTVRHGQNSKRRSRNIAWSSETTSALLTVQLQKEQPSSDDFGYGQRW